MFTAAQDLHADELYAHLGELSPERVVEVLEALRQEGWQLLDGEARERFLLDWLPEFEELFDLLADFRFGGHRVLPDILLDIDQKNTAQDRKQLTRNGDSPAFSTMMEAYQKKTASQSYRDAVPLFSSNADAAWILRFDDVIADALKLGPLRRDEVELPEELRAQIEAVRRGTAGEAAR